MHRLQVLDILRGVSLFGIFAVNLPFMASSLDGLEMVASWADWLALWGVAFAGHAKFFVLFSFLFGYGVALQLERSAALGRGFGRLFARRLIGLLAIGVCHAVFLFAGDILTIYAVVGVLLWWVRHWTVQSLCWGALGAYGFSILAYAVLGGLVTVGSDPETEAWVLEANAAYLGTFWDAARQRVIELPFVGVVLLLFNGFPVVAMFLLGLAAGKVGLIERLPEWSSRLRPLWWRCLWVGVIGNVIYAFCSAGWGPENGNIPFWLTAFGSTLLAFSWPPLAACYLMGVVMLVERFPRWRVFHWLGAAGRMSLTNYVAQSVLGGFVFLGWGLGYYGQVGPAGCLALTVGIFGLQLFFSIFWLRFFRYGPEEWLLRCWTYWKWLPFRQGAKPTGRA